MKSKSKRSGDKKSNPGRKDTKVNVKGVWKEVSTSSVDDVDYDLNHYDDPKLSNKALEDLPVQPGEDVAMFYGLEILDGSQYEVVGTGESKRLKILNLSDVEITSQTHAVPRNKRKQKFINSSKSDDETSTTKPDTNPVETPTLRLAVSAHHPMNAGLPTLSWQEVQQNWMSAAKGAVLDVRLCHSLARLGFSHPTPIQAATMSASILGRRNLVGAAPTGSGKTLAFLLPIFQKLLEQPEPRLTPRAMIITPTRELAAQIYEECEKLVPNNCVTLVGGVAQVKQERLLQTKRPPIIVGTPGRLWAMVSSGEHEHLNDLSQIQFLALDEADRLTQDHSFPQLLQILERVHQQNPGLEEDQKEEEESTGDDDNDRLLGLPGIRGEAPLAMLTPEILRQIEEQRQATSPPDVGEVPDTMLAEYEANDDDENILDYDEVVNVNGDPPRVHRQTFIYSATLTLPFTSTKATTKKSMRNLPLDGGLAEILDKTHAMGETKVVDLTTSSPSSSSDIKASNANGARLPPGLRLEQIKCTQRHKDSHLYAYLMTTKQGSSGPSLIFCNSIAAVRRVGTTLQTLGLSVRILHAHMQQRARFKAVESLSKQSNSRAVVVCTDVAARGLDIPSVTTVIHYDVARAVDTFVHRAGRTARGMGDGAVGASLSLIAPAEDKSHSKIVQALEVKFSKILLDGRLLTSAQERVNLASKVVIAAEKSHKMQSSNQWFLEKAEEAELELDDDLLEGNDISDVERSELREAHKAKSRLSLLLKQPLQTQKFGKFLSTNSAAMQDEIGLQPSVTQPPSAHTRQTKKRKTNKS